MVHIPYWDVSSKMQGFFFLNVLFTTIFMAPKSVPGMQKTLGKYWLKESMNEVISSSQEEGQGKIPEEMLSKQTGFEG